MNKNIFIITLVLILLILGCKEQQEKVQAGLKDGSLNSRNENETKKQVDTVFASNIFKSVPKIDGNTDDDCWEKSNWNHINYVWMDYNEKIDTYDFSGQFKVVWSSIHNLLYILVEVTDDIFVDGYIFGDDGYHNFDIVEVFIDQNNSGGLHVFDGNAKVGLDWGSNAENAFAYHINVNEPMESETSRFFVACDIDGGNWDSKEIVDYADHFPEFAFRKIDGKYYWEFSLLVYSDSYNRKNPLDSIVKLNEGNVLGFTIAYCDNDNKEENPKTRDHFIGSVFVTEDENNSHWKNADDFGILKLISENIKNKN